MGCLLCGARGVCKYSLKRTKWWVNVRYLLLINGFPPKSLLQSTLELSSSTCIANKVESDQYFFQTPPASFLQSCKILRLFSLKVSLLRFSRSQAIVLSSIISYKFSVLKTCIDYLKMHSECTILMQIVQNFPWETPGPPPAGGGDPLPLSALRASVKPSLVPPAVEVLDPPLISDMPQQLFVSAISHNLRKFS